MAESKIVSAVGVASGMHVAGQEKSDLNKAIEKAMSDAVLQAHKDGLRNKPNLIRRRMLKARDKLLDEPYDG
jgi:hypothetical protein